MSEAKKVEVDVQCSACRGTGLRHGHAEPKGVGVVCAECKGKGETKLSYTPFTSRVIRDDIEFVTRSSAWFFGVVPIGTQISYEEFLEGKIPEV